MKNHNLKIKNHCGESPSGESVNRKPIHPFTHSPIHPFSYLPFALIVISASCILHLASADAESLSDIKTAALLSPVIKEKWGRDPFIKYEEKIFVADERPMDLKVEGIIADGKKALAIINGGFYRKNDKVNGFLIVGIDREKVMLEKDGKRFYLDIKKFAVESVPKEVKK